MKNYQSISTHEEEGGIPSLKDGHHSADSNDSANAQTKDHLTPPFDSDERPSNLFVGTFNLIATIIGGGVLSLPIVFEKCGVAFTTLAMSLSAYMTYMSLILLCYCSRRGGGSSYGEVVRSAFGEKMEEGVSALLCVYLILTLVGYMVLARDIWTPLAQQMLTSTGMVIEMEDVRGDYVLLAIITLMLPFLCQRSLHALRKICYVGFASIFVLCIALCHGGWQRLNKSEEDGQNNVINNINDNIDFFKIPSPQDLLFSFPIVTFAFICHFNIISIHNALSKPTRKRMQNLIQYATGACFLIMYMFGLGGYLYAGKDTQGNILLNVPMTRHGADDGSDGDSGYYLFLLGRIGCGLMILIAMPMNVLPCREALLNCCEMFRKYKSHETIEDAEIATEDEHFEILPGVAEDLSEEGDAEECECNNLRHDDPIQSDYIFHNPLAHYGSTLFIAIAAYSIATAVSGVAVVWSFIGSSMSFCIAFILPCGCFIAIESGVPTIAEGGDRNEKWIRIARVIFWFSILGAIVCTVNNTVGLGR